MEAASVTDCRNESRSGAAGGRGGVAADEAGGRGGASSAVLRDAAGIGIAVGAFGVSYGAIAVASGFTVLQTCALSALMFTGASQFALVGVIGGGGSLVAGVLTALLLGGRN